MGTINNTFAAVNDETDPDTPAPTTPLRSGGPQSLVSLGVARPPGPGLRRGRARRSTSSPKFNGSPGHRADPRLRRAGFRRRHQGDRRAGRAGTAAHRRTEPRGGRRRHHHRHRLDQRGRGVGAGVHVQRQHRDREHAVLVPAQLAVVPGRQGERPPGRPGAVRGRRRAGPRRCPRASGPSWSCSARAWARSAARRRSWR